jgi:hypothetical protein
MFGGQHRDDEANGPSRSGEVKPKEAGIARAINHEKCATPRVCSGKQKLRRNVLDGADFVRDVIDSHQEAASAAIAVLLEGLISFSGRAGQARISILKAQCLTFVLEFRLRRAGVPSNKRLDCVKSAPVRSFNTPATESPRNTFPVMTTLTAGAFNPIA